MFRLTRHSAVQLSLQQLIDCQGFALHTPGWQRLTSAEQAGSHVSRLRGRGMEFDEVRQYQAGDDVRSIDWRVTARTGTPYTKIYREERDRPVVIVIDLSASSFFGSCDKLKAMMAAELAAILGWQAHKQHQRIGLLIQQGQQSHWLRPQSQRSRWLANLQALCDCYSAQLTEPPAQTQTLSESLEFLSRTCRSGYQLHLISDFYALSKPDQIHLSRLSQHNQLSAWQVTDPMEYQLPVTQQLTPLAIRQAQVSGELPLADRQFRQNYQAAANARQAHIEQSLRSGPITFHRISTESDWQDYV